MAKAILGRLVWIYACVDKDPHYLHGLGLYCQTERRFIVAKTLAMLGVQVIRAQPGKSLNGLSVFSSYCLNEASIR